MGDVRKLIEAVLFTLRDGRVCEQGRMYAETYDTMMEAERNPTGAFMAIEDMDAAMEKAQGELRAILRAMEGRE